MRSAERCSEYAEYGHECDLPDGHGEQWHQCPCGAEWARTDGEVVFP